MTTLLALNLVPRRVPGALAFLASLGAFTASTGAATVEVIGEKIDETIGLVLLLAGAVVWALRQIR